MKKHMFTLVSVVGTWLVAASAFAQTVEGASNDADTKMFAFLAAGLAIGVAAFGGALAQGRAATAALEGIARNPGASDKLFVPMILGLALIESLVIYALIIAFQILGAVK
jgi:F-type H+-transporting ATPase subunit c